MKVPKKPLKVFFNASVVIAGIISPSGGSGKLLELVTNKQIEGAISELILDEVLRHTDKIGRSQYAIEKKVRTIFSPIFPTPSLALVNIWKKLVIDIGDAHVLASAYSIKCNFLVTLDRKHLLILQEKVRKFKIVTPKQLILYLNAPKKSEILSLAGKLHKYYLKNKKININKIRDYIDYSEA